MSLKYATKFSVSGLGNFPIDMLRYDSCFPLHESDSLAIISTFDTAYRTRKPITLTVYHEKRIPNLTPARWQSFLWHVDPESVVTEKLP